jgi:hypothetical protein
MSTVVEKFTAGRENGKRSRPRGYADWRPQATTRALLTDVETVLETYSEHLPLTIRQVYYALVGAGKLDKTDKAYERPCEHLNRARRARLIDFDCIRDDGVSVCKTITYNGLQAFDEETARRARQYRRDYQAGQPYAIELWSEAAPAKVGDTRSRSWDGGTCQLEALPPDVLAQIVRFAILERVDLDVLGEHERAEHRERAELLGLPEGDQR